MRKINLILIFLGLTATAFGQIDSDTTDLGEFVVSGTRITIPVEKSGKTIYKIGLEEIQRSAGFSVADLLNQVPAVQVDGNFGAPGTNLEYYVRGARSKNTLVLIDGVPMNEPTGISLFYDLRYLSLDQVESIEVLKGGLSALYGSNAAAGVISIKLKDNAKEQFAGNVGVSTGSFGRLGFNGGVSGTLENFNYGLNISRETFDGFSAADDGGQPGAAFDNDGFERTNLLFKAGFKTNSPLELDFVIGYDDFVADIDAFAFTDELDAIADNKQTRLGFNPKYTYEKGFTQLRLNYVSNERVFENAFPSTFNGKNLQVDLYNQLEIGDFAKAIFGLNLQRFVDDSNDQVESDFTIFDPYFSVIFDSKDGLNLHVGIRANTHSIYETEMLSTINPSMLFQLNENTSLKAFISISNAYNTPSLFQLNSPFFGNSELTPERTNNYEIGSALYAGGSFTANLAFFVRDEQNAIDFVSIFDSNGMFIGGNYANIEGLRRVQGIETDISWEASDKLTFTGNYSKLATNNDASFARIPKLKYGAGATYKIDQSSSVALNYIHTGERLPSPFDNTFLNAFDLVNFSVRKTFLDQKLAISGSINNLFDEEFVGVSGFTTIGRNYSLKLSYGF